MDAAMRKRLRDLTRRGAVLAACGLAMVQPGCRDGSETPPNLVLVTVDSLRADFLACYDGNPKVGLHLCGLGQAGTRYAWAFAPASNSAPSIASLLTSRYPSTHGVDESAATFLADEFVTLPESLRDAGYATAAFVGSPELNRSRNLQQGFGLYDDRTSRTQAAGLPWRPANETTTAALDWLRNAKPPWFVWIHYREPHGPYELPADREPDAGLGAPHAPGERLRVLTTPTGRGGIPGYQAIPGLFTREGYEARYREAIRSVDLQIERLVASLEATGLDFGMLVTADHGEAFGEDRYYFSHGHSVGLDQIRVPLVWRSPRGDKPDEIRVPVSTLDVMPTLLRAAGVEPPGSLQGWQLPNRDDPPGAPEQARAVFSEHPLQVSVVSGESFYSRLREPTVPMDRQAAAEVTPEYLRATVARAARLGDRADTLPPMEPARATGIAQLLEPLLFDFATTRSEAGDDSESETLKDPRKSPRS